MEPADLMVNNALIVTVDARRRILRDASVVVQGNRIAPEALRTYGEIVDQFHGAANGRLSVWIHLTGVGSATDELLVGAKRLADARGLGLSMHQSQHEDEVAEFVAQHGRRPMEHFADL